MKVFIYFNQFSGRFSLKRLNHVRQALNQAGYEYTVQSTYLIEGPLKMAQDIRDADAVLILGGDGTINYVVSMLIRFKLNPVVGILPFGTANVICRDLNIKSVDDFIRGLQQNTLVSMDIMRIGRHISLLGIGSGFCSLCVRDVNHSLKKKVGRLAYFAACLPNLFFYLRRKSIRVTALTGVVRTCNWIIVMNTKHFAGGFKLNPNRDLADGVFELYCLTIRSFLDWIRLAKAVVSGRIDRFRGCETLVGSQFDIESDFPFQIDGDLSPKRSPAKVRAYKSLKFVYAL